MSAAGAEQRLKEAGTAAITSAAAPSSAGGHSQAHSRSRRPRWPHHQCQSSKRCPPEECSAPRARDIVRKQGQPLPGVRHSASHSANAHLVPHVIGRLGRRIHRAGAALHRGLRLLYVLPSKIRGRLWRVGSFPKPPPDQQVPLCEMKAFSAEGGAAAAAVPPPAGCHPALPKGRQPRHSSTQAALCLGAADKEQRGQKMDKPFHETTFLVNNLILHRFPLR